MSDMKKNSRVNTKARKWLLDRINSNSKEMVRKTGLNFDSVTLVSSKNGNYFDSAFEITDLQYASNIGNIQRIHTQFLLPLSSLNIQNIKSFENLNLEPSNLNLFAGKNSSGKSTILETIALLSNWANSNNTVYEGLPFKYDFGIKNFSEFKSNFSDSDENIIIDFDALNVSDHFQENAKLGNAKISFVLGGVDEKEEHLKYAPLNSLRFEFDNILQFDNESEDSNSEDLHGYKPVHTIVEYHKNPGNSSSYDEAIDKGFALSNFHGKTLNKLNLYKDKPITPYFVDDSLNYKPYQFPTINTATFIRASAVKKDQIKIDNNSFPYVDVSVNLSKSSQRKTRLYGCSFSSGDKEFKPVSHRDIDLFLGLNQNYLIRWLALDYIQQKSRSLLENSSKQKDGLSFLTSINDLANNILKNDEGFIELINKETSKGAPPVNALEILADNLVDSLFNLNLKIPFKETNNDGSQNISSEEYKFLGLFDFPTEGYSIADNLDNYQKIDMTDVLDWIQNGNRSLKSVNSNIKMRKKLISKDTTFDDTQLDKLKSSYEDFTDISIRLLSLADQAIVNISDEDSKDLVSILSDIYKEIDTLLGESNFEINFYNEWDATKFRILEILSSYTLESSLEMKSNKAVLFPFNTELTEEYAHSVELFDNINTDLNKSFENLFTATFIGPLRERSEFKDDIFSYNYPFTLGIKGEKSGSFLSTFSENVIRFVKPTLINDIEKGSPPNYQKHIKSGTYTEHLSDWLKFLELADKIEVSSTGAIEIFQGSKGEKNLSLDNIGVGVSQVLPVLLSCMASQSAEVNELLLLEQPELHLHPSAQAKLADFFIAVSLSNKKTLFVETHSEHILNRLRLRKIQIKNDKELIKIFFSKKKKDDKSEINEFTINEDGSYDFEAYPEGFFDQTQLESREIAKALITKQTKKTKKNQ